MARKLCPICGIRNQYTGPGDDPAPRLSEMCNPCFTEGGWENTHDDEGHDDPEFGKGSFGDVKWTEKCWICHPELNLAKRPVRGGNRKGHNSPRRKQLNHRTQCKHPQTPQARRACREAFWAEQAAEQAEPAEAKPAKAKTKK